MSTRKIGRNKVSCARYRAEGRRIKNKIIKITKHLFRHVNDKQSEQRLEQLDK